MKRRPAFEIRLLDAILVAESCSGSGSIVPIRFIIFLFDNDDFIAPHGNSSLNAASG
jgi:hypothetical protein